MNEEADESIGSNFSHNDDDDNNAEDGESRTGSNRPRVSFHDSTNQQSSRGVRTRLRQSSSLSQSNTYDNNLLSRAVADAGRWAYGVLLVECWALSADRTYLFRPTSGWWVDPVWHRDCSSDCKICRLTDSDRDDFLEPQHLAPGVGLPGVLWSEAHVSWSKSFRETLASRLLGRGSSGGRHEFPNEIQMLHPSNHVVWRDVKQLEADPDQPWNPRLSLLAELGLGWAAAVPFNLGGDQGIVIYMTREDVDMERLQNDENESYLIAASDLIGAAYALRGPRQAVVSKRRKELKNALHRVRDTILAARRMGIGLDEIVKKEEAKKLQQKPWDEKKSSGLDGWIRRLAHICIMTGRKSRGAGAPSPPSFSWRQTLLTWVGSFTTLLVLSSCSHVLSQSFGPDYSLVLGPMGALMTLLYGLTAAPASQPRNAMLGQAISMSLGIGISYLTTVPVWFRQSLATSLAISCMVKLSLIHPPAGASALIFASGRFGWTHMGMLLLANAYAIVLATLINNTSRMRQYPISWGLGFIPDAIKFMYAKFMNLSCTQKLKKQTQKPTSEPTLVESDIP